MAIARRTSALQSEDRALRAILTGVKTQSRRIVKPQPPPPATHWYVSAADSAKWQPAGPGLDTARKPPQWQVCPHGRAGETQELSYTNGVPACRIVVLAVRVERLQALSESDAAACAPAFEHERTGLWQPAFTQREAYALLWSEKHGRRAWDANPWVWVVGYKVLTVH
jgi:hypothetical protein